MAKFLDTTGISYHLQQLINNATEKLILISPFLQLNDRLKQSLEDKDRMKIDVRIIYGKSELQPAENNWLKSLRSIRTSFCQNLHAKCYLNENGAIITSMNLYVFSQINNIEMGVYIDKADDEQLYSAVYTEAMRLVRISEEIKVSVATVPKVNEKTVKNLPIPVSNDSGFCIRCGEKIKLNPMVPYCRKCFNSWKKYENEEHKENTCHICGKQNKSSLIKPTCYDCYTANKNKLEFPLA
jgi:phosphatidylserine/phosphatidylglycerophosphate/cardiolipin synthase-like enzyme